MRCETFPFVVKAATVLCVSERESKKTNYPTLLYIHRDIANEVDSNAFVNFKLCTTVPKNTSALNDIT
jgi:hypothetical protein